MDMGAEIQEASHPYYDCTKTPNNRLDLATANGLISRGNFEHGLAKLRMFLREMDSPKGILTIATKTALLTPNVTLRRAKGDEAQRIQVEIEELKTANRNPAKDR